MATTTKATADVITMNLPQDFCEVIAFANGWTHTVFQEIEKTKIVSSVEEGNVFVNNLQENKKFIKAEKNTNDTHTVFYSEISEIDNPISQEIFAKEAVKKLSLEKYAEAKSSIASHQLKKEAEEVEKQAREEALNADITVS